MQILKRDWFWTAIATIGFVAVFYGPKIWEMVTFSDKRTPDQVQEDRLLQECFNEATRVYGDSFRTIEGQTLNKATEIKIGQFDTTYAQSKEGCYMKYHRGYKEYLKYREERP